MAGDSYDGGLSRANKWGLVGAAIVGLPLFAFLLLMDALGDCEPGTGCRKGFLLMVLAPTFIAASAVGLTVRLLVKRSSDNP